MASEKWTPGFGENMEVLQKHILECQPGTYQDLFDDVPHLHEEESGNQDFKGTCKPIFSKSFCDMFQLDIIDF